MKSQFLQVFKEALEMEDEEVQMSDEFRGFDTWDSLSRLSLIALFDEHFEIAIEDSEFEELTTVEDLFNAVQSKINS